MLNLFLNSFNLINSYNFYFQIIKFENVIQASSNNNNSTHFIMVIKVL